MKQIEINQEKALHNHLLRALSTVEKQSMLKTLHFIKSNLKLDLPAVAQKELNAWQIEKTTREMPDNLRRRAHELIFEFYRYPLFMNAIPSEYLALEATDLINDYFSRYYRRTALSNRNGEMNLSIVVGKYASILYPTNQEYGFGYFSINPCCHTKEKLNFLSPLNRLILFKATADVELPASDINAISKLIPGNDSDAFSGLTGVTGDFNIACTYKSEGVLKTKTSSYCFLSRFQAADRAEAAFYMPRFKAILEVYLPAGVTDLELTLHVLLGAYTSRRHDEQHLESAEQLAYVDLRDRTDYEHPLFSVSGVDVNPPGGIKLNNIHFQFFEGNVINNDDDTN